MVPEPAAAPLAWLTALLRVSDDDLVPEVGLDGLLPLGIHRLGTLGRLTSTALCPPDALPPASAQGWR